jgi:hypothetical protein
MRTDDAKVLSRKARALNPSDRIALVEDVLDSLDKIDPSSKPPTASHSTPKLGICLTRGFAAVVFLVFKRPGQLSRQGLRGCTRVRLP